MLLNKGCVRMENKKSLSIYVRIVFSLVTIIMILAMLLFSYVSFKNITDAINLTNNGVYTSAKVLEHRNRDNYSIFYDNYKQSIYLPNGKSLINSNIPVVYDKSNPKLVWVGNRDMNAWDLYYLNTNLFVDFICLLAILMSIFYIYLFSRGIIGKVEIKSKKSCPICHTVMEQYLKSSILYYKYCPECGTESNENICVQKYYKYKYFLNTYLLLLIPFFVVIKLFWGQYGGEVAIGGYSLFYLIFTSHMKFSSKQCPNCFAYLCKRKHKFCYNCRQKFE